MKDEAANARGSLSSDRSNLTSEARADARVQPPFSSSQMTETALHNEVLAIWRNAGPETRSIYDRGAYMDGQNVDNWIIRWVLWHVFRYRDSRNGPRPNGGRSRQRHDSESSSAWSPSDESSSACTCSPFMMTKARLTVLITQWRMALVINTTLSEKYGGPITSGSRATEWLMGVVEVCRLSPSHAALASHSCLSTHHTTSHC